MVAVAFSLPAAALAATPAQIQTDNYLAVFNRGDQAAYAAFIHANWPTFSADDDEFAGNEDRSRDQSGGYDLVEVLKAEDTSEAEIVKAHLADDYFRLDVHVTPTQDHQIERLTLTPIPRPGNVPPPARLAISALIPLVDQRLKEIGDFSGAVLIARRGHVVYTHAEGLADHEQNIPNTVGTRFRMASMGKMFTAVAVMQLVQSGRLDLNAPIGVYLKDYPNSETARTVTISQLLTHTGGTGDFMSQKWADNIAGLNTPAEYVAMFGGKPPAFTPGARFDYSNFGYVILGRIIEVASDQPYEVYLRDHVFLPAGMFHSGVNSAPAQAAMLAKSYVKTKVGYEEAPLPFRYGATPAGAAFSTVEDMLAFVEALDRHVLLDQAHTELMTTSKVRGDDGSYGYGFQIRGTDGVRDVGHDGGGPGQNGGLRILDNGRAVVVVLSNVSPTWRADKLCKFIAARIDPTH
jgi:CubicO group peptidase (beta-lactamase class C family)